MKFMLATRIRIAFALLLLTVGFASAASAAATSDFKIYLDLDNDQATGCPLLPTLSGSFTTAEEILDVTVNVGATRSIAGVTRLVCNPSTHLFVAGTAPAAAIGQGLGTPVGATPSDVIETALPLAGTGAGKQVRIGFTSIFNGNGATDQLLTLDGTPGGAPITVQLIPDVPALGGWGLLLLALLLTGSACLMIRRRGHRRAALLLLVLALSGGLAWAAGLVVDGNPADWTGVAATIATDVPGDAAANADIVKAFAALQTNTLYLRLDVLFETLPTGVNDSYNTLEDTQLSVPQPGVLANDTGDNLVATAQTGAATAQGGSVTLQTTGAFVYTPPAGFVGSDSFTYTVTNSSGTSSATVTITIAPVNHAPSFTKGADQAVLEDAGPQTVPNWATAISPGPANESGQTVSFQVTADTNAALFSTPPAVDSSGTLTYTTAPDANGTATITLVAKDNGGTANGGVDTSAPQTFNINVTPVNDAPSFTKGPDQTVLENAGAQTVNPWATAISPGPADEAGQTVSFNVTANTNAALFSAGPAISSTGVLTYTPATDQFGTATITIDLQDNGGTANGGVDTSATQTFVITVSNVNHAPSFTKGADQTVLEDAGPQTVPNWATAISAGTNESGQTVTFQVTADTNAALFSTAPAISPTGTLTYTPAANANGTATITIDLKDDGGTANGGVDTSPTQTFVITVTAVNDAPSFTKGADQTVLENAGPQTVSPWATAISAGPPDESTQTLTFQVTANTNAALFAAGPAVSSTGVLTYTPATNTFGTATITIDLKDNGGTANGGVDTSATQTFTITVTNVNQPPSFTKGPDVTVLEDAGPQTISPWATAISPGPGEGAQTVTFQVTGDTNAALFSTPPAVSPTGVLTFTAAANANGTATLTLVAKDNGGTANGGVDTSAPQTFVINVTAVNDAPSFTKGADQTVLENAGPQTVSPWATAISAGPPDESAQTLTFQVTGNTNAALFAAGPAVSSTGVLTYTPATNTFGTATITLVLKDNGGTANGGVDTSAAQTFVITVNNVNQPPSFTKGADQTVLEDAGPQTVSPWATGISPGPGEGAQTVTFQVTGDTNAALFSAGPAVSSTGVLTYTPAANANGTAAITLVAKDNGGTANGGVDTSAPQTFNITVTAVNDAPSFTKGADQTVLENAGPQTVNPWATAVSAGPANEAGQTLTFLVTGNTNAALFAVAPAVSSTGVLTYTPATNTFGSATITLVLKDNGGTANGGVDTSAAQTFVINVSLVNQAPSFTKGPDQTALENSGPQTVNPWATAISPGPASESGQTVAFNITGDTNPSLFSAGPAVSPTGVLTYTPAPGVFGTATITLVLMDNGGTANGGVDTSAPQTFTITLTQVNQAPSFTKGPDVTVLEDAGPQSMAWATAISPGPASESGQTVHFNITGDTNASLFSVAPAVSPTGVLTFTPAANANGTATITLNLQDDGGTSNGGTDTSASQTFVITVTAVNDAPSFTKGPDQNVLDNAGAITVNPWATAISAGPANESGQTLTFNITGNTNPGIFAAGPSISPSGVLTYTPAIVPAGTSTATITVVLMDNGGTANGGVDTSAPQTFTIAITHVNVPPHLTTNPVSYTTPGNTQLHVGATLPGVAAWTDAQNITAKAQPTDTDGPGTLSIVAASGTTANGGSYAVSTNGSFTYVPAAGFTGADSFTYQATDTQDTTTGTVNITVGQRVWYIRDVVDGNNPAGGDGRSTNAFDSIAAFNAATTNAGDIIYIFEGNTGTTPLSGSITLKDSQKLWGQGIDLNVPGFATPLVTATNKAHIRSTAASTPAVSIPATAGNRNFVEVRGLDLSTTGATSNAVDVTSSGTNTVGVTISDDNVSAATAKGVNLSEGGSGAFTATLNNDALAATGNAFDASTTAGAGTLTISFSNNAVVSNATGININGAAGGTTWITNFANNAVSQNNVGTGIAITSAKFDATPGGSYQTVSGGTTVVGTSGNGVGASGVVLTNVSGDLAFTDLDIFADAGAALRVTGAGAVNTGAGTGTRVTVGAGVATFAATGGPAVDVTNTTIDLQLAGLTSANSASTGVSLDTVTGTFSAPSGSTITSATGTDFNVNAGNATVTYNGTITDTTGRLVSVANATGGTVSFAGAISDTGSGTGQGISLNSNTGATISFSAPLTLSTGGNDAFTATGGGTVTATDTTSTIATTTGTALNVANTTIGAGGLKFKSVSANGGANGIVLNTTGTSGGLTVSGTGTAGSGGTIRNMVGGDGAVAGNGIYLNSTSNVSLSWLQLNDFQNFAIRGISVNGFTLNNTTINGTNGNNAAAPFNEGSVSFTNLTGSASFSTDNVSGGFSDNIRVVNTAGTLNRVTFASVTIGANSTANGNDGLTLEAQNAATLNVTVQGSTFTSARGDLFQLNLLGTSTSDLVFTGNTLSNNHPAIATGGGGVTISGGDNSGTGSNLTFNIANNTFRDSNGHAVLIVKSTDPGTFSGAFTGNMIGVAAVPDSGSVAGSGIKLQNAGLGTVTASITGNQIRQYNNFGIELETGGGATAQSGSLNTTITGNAISNPGTGGLPMNGIQLNAGTVPGDTYQVCSKIGGAGALANSITGSGANGGTDFRLRQRQSTTVRLPGYAGANNDNTAVVTFVQGNNGGASGLASNTVGSGGGGFVGGGGTCP